MKVLAHIKNLIHCLVNIEDETGEFLMTLPDGRIIDTKGWNDWEVCGDAFFARRLKLIPGRISGLMASVCPT